MANEVVARKPTELEVQLADYEPQFAAVLPSHIAVDKFKRIVITAINQNPDLIAADRRSLFSACTRAAQDGLLPDGREAALVVFNSKDKKTNQWRKLVQYMPMIDGIYKRLRNSGDVAAISSYVVFEHDKFDYELGDNPRIEHKPAMGDRGQPIGVYAIAKLTNGEILREVMSVGEVEKIRAVSRSKDDGPWVQWWEMMARKSVTRRLARRLPGSSDIDAMLRREEEQYDRPTPVDVPLQRPQRHHYAAQIVEHEPESLHDAETGEVQSERSLVDIGNEKCEEGIEALRAWWKELTPAQRGELGAKGRGAGPHFEAWAVRANAADLRGGPAPDDEDEAAPPPAAQSPEAEASVVPADPPPGETSGPFNLPETRSLEQVFSDNVFAQVAKCRTLDEVEAVEEQWKPQIDDPAKLSRPAWLALSERIGSFKRDLQQAQANG